MNERTFLAVSLAASAAVPVALAAGLVPVRDNLPNASVALILAVAVALLAALGTRLTAIVAAASAGIGFDVFHTRPYGSLAINHAPDLETTLLLLAVGLVVGQLAVRNRFHRTLAAEASYDLGRVHAVAELVASGAAADLVVDTVASELTDLLGLRKCWFDPQFAEKPGPFIEGHGGVGWGGLRWGFRTMGLPAQEVTLVVQHQGRPLGRFVLLPAVGFPVTRDRLVAAVALADQAGAALAAQATVGGA
jgi:hypothetical protein